MVEDRISADDDAVVVVFDAWLFQGFDDARAALLETIGTRLLELSAQNPTLEEKATSLLKRVDPIRALSLAGELGALAMGVPLAGLFSRAVEGARDVADGTGDRDDLTAIKDATAAVSKGAKSLLKPAGDVSPPEAIEAFRTEFCDVLEHMGKTLYVFIDNLDRCLPSNAIHTLEAIKQFLFMDNTTFVIAADETMIRHAVQEHYKSFDAQITRDYLDKLVQYPVRIPSVGVLEMRALLLLLVANDDQVDAGRETLSMEERDALRTFIVGRLQESWEKPFPAFAEILKAAGLTELTEGKKRTLHDADQLSGIAAEILATAPSVKGNPRIVKRLLNTLYQRKFIGKRRNIPLPEAAILKLVIFERCAGERATRELYRMIAESLDGKLAILTALEAEDENATLPSVWDENGKFITDWAKLSPPLGDLDLRPAVYLARDLRPTQIGFSGLSEVGQQAFDGLMAAERRSSPAVKKIVSTLSEVEKPTVMDALIVKLAEVSDWATQPPGWPGALALAATDSDSAAKIDAFARRQVGGNLPRWMAKSLESIKQVDI